ncbi:amidohydrolase family protein [Sulfolobus acidocaldarius]|uniref:Cytosine deaminase n=4 Tax=Sulfolobus acidocaldarius TaxID=2285 RepID=Q4J9V1_SULAC|nr:amidohydrolase family protein [Sulfolobus acidocaldarius]AAY80429.1 cytosine deaminase [Sulfolobus acidocaldarius DSM 639]AGE71013.1 cytosine deaminase [Sulfolobus acidocaldarius N8]AGE73284.1 cytosine deaminase [Sulfolobus acidocaldarius Ron12/I]ALU28690.1 amidohydrolase [Sulfolobus acidocaldarius]ALU31408.1 amidohydrolase [Sulfolobus acidocaldarius]
MLIKNARLEDGRIVDIKIDGDKITCIGNCEREEDVLEANGKLVLPPYLNMHFHLDSVFTKAENQSGTLWEGIKIWKKLKQELTEEQVYKNAVTAVKLMVAFGTLWLRTHVDITEKSFRLLRALLKVKEDVKELMDIQITAFPQDGIFTDKGNEELMYKALSEGADNVGLIPHNELTREDGVRSIKFALELGKRYNRDIDGHIDETDDPNSRFLEVLAKETLENGWVGRVAAGHVTAMHSWDNAYRYRILPHVANAGISVIPNPLINAVLQGRLDTYPKRRGMAPIKEMLNFGVNVALGYDCMMDPWYPLGSGNMLQALFMAIHLDQLTGYEELRRSIYLITYNGAKALRIKNYGICVGCEANLIVTASNNVVDLIRFIDPPSYVIRKGKIVAEKGNRILFDGKWEEVKREP